MIASLPMYDRPETEDAFDLLWAKIRNKLLDTGISAPERLVRGHGATMTAWTEKKLLISQTCGLPFRKFLLGKVSLIGTPDYGYRACPRGHYFSCLIANAEDGHREFSQFNGRRLAFNELTSQSGWAAPMAEAKRAGIRFGSYLQTGSHKSSALAVAEGRADLAALDVNSWGLIKRFDDFASSLRALGETRPTPGLPFITAFSELSDTLFNAIENCAGSTPGRCCRSHRVPTAGKIERSAICGNRQSSPPFT